MNKTAHPQPRQPAGSSPRRHRRTTDHDFLWKGFLQFFLRAFILFVKPGLHRDIDWNRPPESLEQEMRNALRRHTKRKKYTDLLFKVWLKNGEEKWILILLEVQSYFDALFCERIFQYYNLLFNKYQVTDIAIFALYTGESVPKVFDRFERNIYGTSVRLKFTAVRATKHKEDALLKSKNPVALAFLANLWRIQTKSKPKERADKILRLAAILRERKYDYNKFYEICNFVAELLALSKSLEKQFIMKATSTVKSQKPEPILPLMPRKSDRWRVDAIHKAYFGWSPLEVKKENKKLEKRIEQVEQQAKQAEQQAKQAEQLIKQTEQQAKQEAQQARQAEQKAKRVLVKSVRVLSKDLGWDGAKIAAHLGVETAEVEKILARKK